MKKESAIVFALHIGGRRKNYGSATALLGALTPWASTGGMPALKEMKITPFVKPEVARAWPVEQYEEFFEVMATLVATAPNALGRGTDNRKLAWIKHTQAELASFTGE